MRWLNLLGCMAIPAALLVHYFCRSHTTWEPTVTFALAGIGIIPLASLMGQATEQLAEQTGPTWGGLLNATFGNAAELIIGIVAVSKGLGDVAKASLTGSILGNLLLVGGGAMLVGGLGRERQFFSRASSEANAGLLVLAVAGMMLPAIFDFSFHAHDAHLLQHEVGMSVGTSVILLIVYGLGLLFALHTHSHIFSSPPAQSPEDPAGLVGVAGGWSVRKSVLALLVASIAVAVLSEMLVGSIEQMSHSLGWNRIFVGVILLAIIGNAAEHSTALLLARRNDMDTVMTIVFQSSLQIALFVTPVLVLFSLAFGHWHAELKPITLVFSPLEVVGVFLSVIVVVTLSRNGESNWFEGVLLLAVYAILAITFFYIPQSHGEGYDEEAPAAVQNHASMSASTGHEGLPHAVVEQRIGPAPG